MSARIEGFPELTIGLLGSVYFAGMLAGTLAAPAIVRRGGHIRAFAAFVALAVVSVILMPVLLSPWAWLGCARCLGFVFAGLYAVIESWINAKATNANRGALYALYQIANFAASAAGSWLLKPLGAGGFSAFRGRRRAARARDRADGDDERRSAGRAAKRAPPPASGSMRMAPLPCCAVLAAGAANGAAVGARAGLRASGIGMAPTSVPWFTTAIVLGSALGVLPIAALSDRFDRRWSSRRSRSRRAAAKPRLSRMAAPGASLLVARISGRPDDLFALYARGSHANDRGAPHDLMLDLGRAVVYLLRRGDRRAGAGLGPR